MTIEKEKKHKKIQNLTTENEECKKEIQGKNKVFEDIQQKWQVNRSKIETIFSEMSKEVKTWKTKYYASQEENKTLQNKLEDHKEKETKRQTLVPPKDTQTTESTPLIDEETDDSSITVEWPILASLGILGLRVIIRAYIAMKNSSMPIIQDKTPQHAIPLIESKGEGSTPTRYFIPRENQNLRTHGTTDSMTYSLSGENTGNTSSNQEGMIRSNTQTINNSVTSITTIPDLLCSGTYLDNYEPKNGVGYTGILNPQENMIPTHNNSEVTIENTLNIQCSGPFFSSHLEAIGPVPDTKTIQPSPFQIPMNYYITLPSPLPDDLSEVYPMKQLMNLEGIPFQEYLAELLKHRGCMVERTKRTHDKGADLIVMLEGKKTIIQAKQKPKVRNDAIQQAYSAKGYYTDKGAKHAIVITTGTFTKDALEEAEKLGIECWDGKRLLQEIYKDQFFYLPS